MTTHYRIDPNTITPDAAIRILERSITEIAHYISHYFDPTISPFAPNDAPRTYFSDDDTDYLPAANDLLTTLINYRCDDFAHTDERDDIAQNMTLDLFRRIATCSLDPDDYRNATDAPCIHTTAAECDATIFKLFAPEYDDCPNLRND